MARKRKIESNGSSDYFTKTKVMFPEPEENNCFSIISRGEYQEQQNNRLKHANAEAVVRLIPGNISNILTDSKYTGKKH